MTIQNSDRNKSNDYRGLMANTYDATYKGEGTYSRGQSAWRARRRSRARRRPSVTQTNAHVHAAHRHRYPPTI